MKKLSLLILTVLALGACDKKESTLELATAEDYAIVKAEVSKESSPGIVLNPIIKSGKRGDMIVDMVVPVEATPQLKAIYQKKKTAKFLSIDMVELQKINPQRNPYAKSGTDYCLVNIITREGAVGNCDARIFCGPLENINYNDYYAVELCKE
ncbi:MAG: hypothetical protein LBL21_00800 [Rickettsiales bacterium]|nr:hypothetical protein [Rickettsiales bacterium]